jgi:phosphoglycolate phosphatase
MAHYQAINGQFSRVYDGVEQGLQNLHRTGLRMACVTNKPTVLAQGLLQAKGLSAFFELVLGGDAVTRKKPDPQALLMACERLGVAPAQTLMIGDSSNDAQAGRAAGCPVLLVTYGYNHGQPVRDVVADGFTDSLADIAWED